MQFKDRDEGEYRIHAGSLEPQAGHGFLASVIVHRAVDGKADRQEVYRNTDVSGGRRWLTSDLALEHALLLGANAVTVEQHRLANDPWNV